MNPEKQRRVIAEKVGVGPMFEGWCVKHPTQNAIVLQDWSWNVCDAFIKEHEHYKSWKVEKLLRYPDVLNDLNAVHEAEKMLTVGEIELYVQHLVAVTSRTSAYGQLDRSYWLIHADAAQRCEALLRTWGLWEETK